MSFLYYLGLCFLWYLCEFLLKFILFKVFMGLLGYKFIEFDDYFLNIGCYGILYFIIV